MRQTNPLRTRDGASAETRESIDEWLEAAMAERAAKLSGSPRTDDSQAAAPIPPAATPSSPAGPGRETFVIDIEATRAEESTQAQPTSFEQRIKEISDRLNAPRPVARRGAPTQEAVKAAVAEIRTHQERIAADTAVGRVLDSRPTDATMRGYTETLASLRSDMARIMGHVDRPAPTADVAGLRDELRQDIDGVRERLEAVAHRDDVERVSASIAAVSDEVVAKLAHSASLPYSREIESLRAEIQRLGASHEIGDDARLSRGIDVVSHKIDMLLAAGLDPNVLAAMSLQLDEIRSRASAAASGESVEAVSQQVSALQADVTAIAGRQIDPTAFTSLRAAVEEMRAALAQGVPALSDTREAVREEIQPVEALLASLIDKINTAERRGSDSEALDQLERHVATLVATLGTSAGRSGSTAHLEGAMSDLLAEVMTWRQGTIEAAERAARNAVAETLEACPPGTLDGATGGRSLAGDIRGLRDEYAAIEANTQEKLSSVLSALGDISKRLGDLEATTSARLRRPLEEAAADLPTPPSAPRQSPVLRAPPPLPVIEAAPELRPTLAADAPEAPVARTEPAAPIVAAAPIDAPALRLPAIPDEADRPVGAPADEILLEPGSMRPKGETTGGSATAPEFDIKSSFISAARRAAQAAAADVESQRKANAAAAQPKSRSELVARLKALVAANRRQLIIGAAAVALAFGAFELVRDFASDMSGEGQQPVVVAAPSAPTAVPARPATPPSAEPLTTQSIPETAPLTAPDAATPPTTDAKAAETSPVAKPAEPAKATSAVEETPRAAPKAEQTANAVPTGLTQAASSGNPQAMYELAARMSEGRGLPRNPQTAAGFFEKAADKGLVPAQYRIGNIYEKGAGVPRNIETAKSWYRKAAEAGNIRAMHNLAVLLAEGSDGKPDYAAAVTWFQKAAEFGVRDSQYNLAVLSARGLGVQQDLGRSYLWFALAAQQGDTDAAKKRDEVAGRLGAADLAKAKASVEKWRAATASPAANDVTPPANGWSAEPAAKAGKTTG